jgi:hypothetical protein
VVSGLVSLGDKISMVGFIGDSESFLKTVSELPTDGLLFCHQTFDGSTYENGFYASDGLNPALVPSGTIISGHIHKPQSFGKVIYVGAPRWRTVTDANTDRALVLFDIVDGKIVSQKRYLTEGYCTKIVSIKEYESSPLDYQYSDNTRLIVDLYGSEQWIAHRKMYWTQKFNARIRTFPVQDKGIRVMESAGVSVVFQKYLNEFNPKNGSSKESLERLCQERIKL